MATRLRLITILTRYPMDTLSNQPEVTLTTPNVVVFCDIRTGARQAVKSVQIELLKDITVFFSEEDETEFFAILPIKIKVKRV